MNKFAVVDLETTGTRVSRDKITEIAIILIEGDHEVSRWQTLVNPECQLSTPIQELTGITDKDLSEAPKFYEIAKTIVQLTEDHILVAHNVRFDYTILRAEFGRLGFTYSRKHLCTLQLARKAFPGKKSYALRKLCKSLKIPHQRAHRAMDDAQATAVLMQQCFIKRDQRKLPQIEMKTAMRESLLPGGLTLKSIHALPASCGVYYFLNKRKQVIYVGKSQNIRRRVLEHFGQKDEKGSRLQKHVHSIKFELTGSELVALLHESFEIKRLQPAINRAQTKRHFPFLMVRDCDHSGVNTIEIVRSNHQTSEPKHIIAEYSSHSKAKSALMFIQQEFQLCGKYLNLEHSKKGAPCFQYHLKSCKGVCAGHEAIEEYNDRFSLAIDRIHTIFDKAFFILDEGRTSNEQAVILVEEGRYAGYGYRQKPKRKVANPCIQKLRDVITPYPGNPDTARIIKRYLKEHKELQVVTVSKTQQHKVSKAQFA